MKSKNYLYIDFGNIFTKITAIDIEKQEILGTAIAPSTHETNILDGLNSATEKLFKTIGSIEFEEKYACSSIDSGLRVVTVGLVSHLSADASKKVALNAGVNVLKTFSKKLTSEDIEEINNLNIDMVLLCGGTDGGNRDNLIFNANKLLEINRNTSIIYAGNKDAAYDCRKILEKHFADFRITENVMPSQNILNIEPIKEVIKEAYVEKVNKLKRFSKVHREISGIVMPTSYAILNAASLLSKGLKDIDGLGEIIVIDSGVMSTNVYSIASINNKNQIKSTGDIPEPYEKRTFEPFGLRNNIYSLLEDYDKDILAKKLEKFNCSINEFEEYISNIKNNPSNLPTNEKKQHIENLLCKIAIQKSIYNHAGTVEKQGDNLIQNGKDLSNIRVVIGIGGPIIYSNDMNGILEGVTQTITKSNKLIPKHPDYYTYHNNIFYALGMLAQKEPEIAITMLKKYLVMI